MSANDSEADIMVSLYVIQSLVSTSSIQLQKELALLLEEDACIATYFTVDHCSSWKNEVVVMCNFQCNFDSCYSKSAIATTKFQWTDKLFR